MKMNELTGLKWAVGIGIIVVLPYIMGHRRTSNPERPKGIPMNPGWIDQWREMRGFTGGAEDAEKMRYARNNALAARSLKSGGILQNLQELGTLSSLDANLKVLLWDNNGYASIRMTQRRYFGGRYLGCDKETGLGLPDWDKLIAAFNIPSMLLANLSEDSAIDLSRFLSADGPGVVRVQIDPDQTYFPKIDSVIREDGQMASAPLHLMSPALDPQLWRRVAPFLEESNE